MICSCYVCHSIPNTLLSAHIRTSSLFFKDAPRNQENNFLGDRFAKPVQGLVIKMTNMSFLRDTKCVVFYRIFR